MDVICLSFDKIQRLPYMGQIPGGSLQVGDKVQAMGSTPGGAFRYALKLSCFCVIDFFGILSLKLPHLPFQIPSRLGNQ